MKKPEKKAGSALRKTPVFCKDDERFMRQALRLAARAAGKTSPNPMVGTVIVKDGRILATGYHHQAGLAHAEVDALQKLGGRAKGATLYVNLEPCNHRGRTAPCCDALLEAGIKRVVVGMIDPNPLVNGSGTTRLRKAGIEVDVGCLTTESRRLNEGFVAVMEEGRPFVTLKLAATADGRTATHSGDSRWITGEAARRLVHEWRATTDAVLVGGATARRDDPLLTVRGVGGRDPVRVVVDSRARLSPHAAMLHNGPKNVLVAATAKATKKRIAALSAAGAEVLVVAADANGDVDTRELLRALGKRGINTVLCEGGATLAGTLVANGLVDKVALFYAPKLLGGGVAMLAGKGPGLVADAAVLREVTVKKVGDDFLLEAYVKRTGPASSR